MSLASSVSTWATTTDRVMRREACLRYRSNRTVLAAIEIDREQLWNGALRLHAGVEELASRNIPCIESEKGIREGPKGLLFFGGKTQLY
jgi:hypothetical protein